MAEIMTRSDFYALTGRQRGKWTARMRRAGFDLDEVAEFSYTGRRLNLVWIFATNDEGQRYPDSTGKDMQLDCMEVV